MTLTAGATLQSNKYVVEAVLNQSDLGTTYRAKHALLQQSIFLQTLSEAVQQRGDFAQLKEQFMAGVRSLSQQTEAQQPHLRVLDCFEEAELPYVVLQEMPEPPQLSDWLTIAPAEAQPPEVLVIAEAPAPSAEAQPPLPITPVATEPPATLVPVSLALPEIPAPYKGSVAPQAVRAKRRVPVALLITALAGLGLGAGAGVALRYQPAEARMPSSRTPKFFSREQPFPSQGDWPITEAPNSLSPEPKLEAPLYRTVPAPDYYSPSPQPYRSSYPNVDLPASAEVAPPAITSDQPIENPPGRLTLPPNPEPEQAIDSPPPDSNYSTFTIPDLQSPAAEPARPNLAPPARSPKAAPANQPPIVRQ